MNFSLKAIAAALALVAAAGAHAAIDDGSSGNGELFLSVWDKNGSYTRDLNISIDAFETSWNAAGSLNLSFAGDAKLASFLSTSDSATLMWNVVAGDGYSANRLLTTYTTPEVSPTIGNNVARTAVGVLGQFVNEVNAASAGADSVIVNNGSTAWAGKAEFTDTVGGYLNFSNAGTLANNSFASGLGFMRLNALSTGTAKSVYNEYLEGTTPVNVWIAADNSLHIAAAVPEPESYAMLLAGLGMIGFMAGRNKRA